MTFVLLTGEGVDAVSTSANADEPASRAVDLERRTAGHFRAQV